MIQTEGSRYVDAAQMFGSESWAAATPPADVSVAAASADGGDVFFQLLCILLLFSIALLLRYRYELGVLLSGLGRGFSEEFDSGRKVTALSDGFFNTSIVTGMLTVAVVAVKYAALWRPDLPEIRPVWTDPATALFAVAAIAAVAAYERLLLMVIGAVTGSRDFIEALLYVKRVCFSTVALALSPVVLLSALSPGDSRGWLWFFVGECLILSFLFLKETFVLFIRKKVPIFQWFLYLCTVEAFPLTLICASIARLR